MKPIKRKFTPVRMLDVLTEIKILCKRNEFLPKIYCKKQPSIWHFTRVLIQKGVLKKEKEQYKWIGGEPNVEMAKAVIDSVNEYNQIKKVERESKIQNTEKFVAESIEFPTSDILVTSSNNDVEPIKQPFENLAYAINKHLKKEIDNANLKISFVEKENRKLIDDNNSNIHRIASILYEYENLKKQLEDYEFEISDLLKENENLKHQIHEIEHKKSKAFDENLEQIKQLIVAKPIPRKVKLLGITILKIE